MVQTRLWEGKRCSCRYWSLRDRSKSKFNDAAAKGRSLLALELFHGEADPLRIHPDRSDVLDSPIHAAGVLDDVAVAENVAVRGRIEQAVRHDPDLRIAVVPKVAENTLGFRLFEL